ncbi:MAG: HAD hydrolase-like protein [SAR324 cluster bacterium]|nr:HAD hydrolase-like protein [SAR324 cluster bacterium]
MKEEIPLFEHLDLIVFDLAGTTLQIGDLIPRAIQGIFLEHGIMLTDSEVLGIRGLSKTKAIEMLLVKHLGPSSSKMTDTLHQGFLKLLEAMFAKEEVRVIPGSEKTFKWLKEKKILFALNTGFERNFTLMLLERIGWSQIADTVVCGDEVPEGRPAPDLIFESMKRLNCQDSSRVAAVGDTQADMKAAEKAQVGFAIGVLSGAHSLKQLEACPNDRVIPSVKDLPKILSLPKEKI